MSTKLPSDPPAVSLVDRIRLGDCAAEGELVRLFSQRIFVMALVRTHDREAARDLVQDVLLAVLRALRNGNLRVPEKLAAFIHGTARNLINGYIRTRLRQQDVEALSRDLPPLRALDPLESVEQLSLAQRSLEQLNATDRKILLMSLVDGLKPGEIAHQLGLASEVVRQRKSRGLRKVAERIKRMSRM
jgi:RNA polymerase sigma-70 factor, ECF subfamily